MGAGIFSRIENMTNVFTFVSLWHSQSWDNFQEDQPLWISESFSIPKKTEHKNNTTNNFDK